MKRIFSVLLVFSIALTGVWAQGQGGGAASQGGVKTITFWHLDTQGDFKELWDNVAAKFMEENPGVKIEITVLENEAFKQKLATTMQSGNPPDVFRSWGGGVLFSYAKAGLVKDITEEIMNSDVGKKISKGALGVYSMNGRVYGVPYTMGGVVLWYNKKLFEKAGVNVPFRTWDDFLAGVKKLKAAGITPITVGAGDKWPAHYWWCYLAIRLGGKEDFERAYTRKGKFTDPSFIKAGEKLMELVNLDPFQQGYLGATYNDAALLMATGEAAMELMGQWATFVYEANATEDGIGTELENLGMMPFPLVEGGKGSPDDLLGGGDGLAIGKNAPPEAVEFLKFIFRDDIYSVLTPELSFVPVIEGAEQYVESPFLKELAKMVVKAPYYQLYYDQFLPPAVGEAVKDASQGLFAKAITPEKAAQMIEEAMAAEAQ